MQKPLVFFGGSFDPVHHGHLIVARAIAEQMKLPRITLVPAARSPHKQGTHASAGQRLEMLRLAVEGEDLFSICELEIHRTGPSYTVQTLRQLRQEHGPAARLAWVIGADNLADLPKWHQIDEVFSLADFVVAVRPPWHLRLDELLASLEHALGPQQVNKLRRAVVPTPTVEISSTDIRRRAAGGKSIRYLVPDEVMQYVRVNRIYVEKT
jgi:nicotinate-nucleotide adenylyltransferase